VNETHQVYVEHPDHPTRGEIEFLLPDIANTVTRNCEVDWAATEGWPGWNIVKHMVGTGGRCSAPSTPALVPLSSEWLGLQNFQGLLLATPLHDNNLNLKTVKSDFFFCIYEVLPKMSNFLASGTAAWILSGQAQSLANL
jgi:hypothetical protein